MKKYYIIFFLFLLLPTASKAGAEIYKVKAGDCLSVIGQRLKVNWRQLARVNNISPPYIIYPGQRLVVPKKAKGILAKAFYWRRPGAAPYKVKNPLRALARFRLTARQRRELLRAWLWNKYGPPREVLIKSGYHLKQMMSRGGQIKNDVVAAFSPGVAVKAREYAAEVNGVRLVLVEPYQIINQKLKKTSPGCYNWGWRQEIKRPEKLPLQAPAAPGKRGQIKPQAAAKLLSQLKSQLKFKLSNETYLFADLCWPIDGRKGWSRYAGFRSNTYLAEYEASYGRWRSGLGIAGGRWQGISASGYHYYGHRFTLGPVIDFSSNVDKDSQTSYSLNLYCGFGRQEDKGHSADKKYKGVQHSDILNPELGFDYDPPDNHLINKYEGWLGGLIDISHKKNSSWQGWPIPAKNDPAEDKNLIYGGLRLYLLQRHGFKMGLYGKTHYALGDHSWGKGGGLFISDIDEIVKISGGPYYTSGSRYQENNGQAFCAAIDIDASKLLKKLAKFLKPKQKSQKK